MNVEGSLQHFSSILWWKKLATNTRIEKTYTLVRAKNQDSARMEADIMEIEGSEETKNNRAAMEKDQK